MNYVYKQHNKASSYVHNIQGHANSATSTENWPDIVLIISSTHICIYKALKTVGIKNKHCWGEAYLILTNNLLQFCLKTNKNLVQRGSSPI